MALASLIISLMALVIAVLVAGFGVVLQFLVFKATSEQTQAVDRNLAESRSEIQRLLGEIEGRTDAMTTTLNQQFNTMLDAFVRRPEAIAEAAREASKSEASSGEALALAGSLRSEIRASADGQEFESKVEDVMRAISSARAAAGVAAQLTEGMKVQQFMSQYHIEGGFGAKPGGAKSFTVDVGGLLKEVRHANIDAGAGLDPNAVEKWHKPLVVADARSVLSGCLQDGLVMVSTDVSTGKRRVVLTDAGEALLELIERRRDEVPR